MPLIQMQTTFDLVAYWLTTKVCCEYIAFLKQSCFCTWKTKRVLFLLPSQEGPHGCRNWGNIYQIWSGWGSGTDRAWAPADERWLGEREGEVGNRNSIPSVLMMLLPVQGGAWSWWSLAWTSLAPCGSLYLFPICVLCFHKGGSGLGQELSATSSEQPQLFSELGWLWGRWRWGQWAQLKEEGKQL